MEDVRELELKGEKWRMQQILQQAGNLLWSRTRWRAIGHPFPASSRLISWDCGSVVFSNIQTTTDEQASSANGGNKTPNRAKGEVIGA